MIRISALALSLLLAAAVARPADLATRKVLSLGVAKQLAAAAQEFAATNSWKIIVAVVDDGGHLLYLERMDGVHPGAVEVVLDKARCAATFRRPTRLFQERVAKGETGIVRLPGVMPFEGGVPIEVDGQVAGAIGISGLTNAQQDGQIAQAALDRLPRILGR